MAQKKKHRYAPSNATFRHDFVHIIGGICHTHPWPWLSLMIPANLGRSCIGSLLSMLEFAAPKCSVDIRAASYTGSAVSVRESGPGHRNGMLRAGPSKWRATGAIFTAPANGEKREPGDLGEIVGDECGCHQVFTQMTVLMQSLTVLNSGLVV